MDVQITDIKSKWNAIRGQFGRELNKVKHSESGQSTDDLYVSANGTSFWDKLQFLQSVMKTTKSWDILSIGNDSFQVNASFSLDEESNGIGKKPTPKVKPLKERKKKRRFENLIAYILYQCFKRVLCCSHCWTKKRHRSFRFSYCCKLKTMSRHTRILAEKRINEAIFEIEMGEFQQHAEGRSTNYNNNFNVSGNPSSFQEPFMSALTNNNVNLLYNLCCNSYMFVM